MIDFLKIEFRKIFSYTTFWVISGLYLALMPVIFYGAGQIEFSQGIAKISFDVICQFPDVWYYLAYLASWFNMLLGLTIVILTCNEFSYRTWRQHVIDGLDRTQLLAGKLLLVLTFSMVSLLYVFVIGLVFGAINTNEWTDGAFFQEIHYLLVYFVQTFGYLALGLLLAVLIRKSALAIILFIFSIIMEGIVRAFIPDQVDQYFPMKILSNLIPNPVETKLMQMLPQQPGQAAEAFSIPITENTIIALGYIVIFIILSYIILKKRDL